MQNRGLASFALHLSKALGREKTLRLLQDWDHERQLAAVKNRVQQLGGNDFAALKTMFSPTFPGFANTLVFEVVESTDTAHELKVTECLWANTWRDEGAAEEGYAAVCQGDFAFARAFNPKIEMVRDQIGRLIQAADVDIAKALPLFDQYLAGPETPGHPPHADAWYRKGQVAVRLGLKAEAIAALESALRLAPDHIGASLLLKKLRN